MGHTQEDTALINHYIDWEHYKLSHPEMSKQASDEKLREIVASLNGAPMRAGTLINLPDDDKPPFVILLPVYCIFAAIATGILCVIAVMLLGTYKLFQWAL